MDKTEQQPLDQQVFLDDQELLKLVKRTCSIWPSTRKTAGQALVKHGDAAIERLLLMFAHEQRRRARRSTLYQRCALTSISIAFAILAVYLFTGMHVETWGNFLVVLAIALLGVGIASGLQSLTHRQTQIASALILFDDVRAVGPLIESLQHTQDGALGSSPTRQHAIKALIRLLPRLTLEQNDLLKGVQCNRLIIELRKFNLRSDPKFLIVIIETLTRIGEVKALPYIRRLAMAALTHIIFKDVRATARRCLPILEAHAKQQQTAQTLLRPSSVSDTPTTFLLRAAQQYQTTESPEQLLRIPENISKNG